MKLKGILNQNIGILGGGQLGKMLAIEAANWHLPLHILDQKDDFPAVPYTHYFTPGDFKNYQDVYEFGKSMDILTIEIEQINVQALFDLEKQGVKVYPKPFSINIIQDKGLQKLFYKVQQILTAPFQLFKNKEEVLDGLKNGTIHLPFVQKSRKDGYDGKGVLVISNEENLSLLLDVPCIIEQMIDIKQEISIIIARSVSGEIKKYEPVEQYFNPEANLVSYLICPAEIDSESLEKMNSIGELLAVELDLIGLLAIEFFIDQKGEIYVNEIAPRPHNSGHHTQNSCETSQFEQHLRAILNLPLGSTQQHSVGAMVNIIGEPGYSGKAKYEGLEECLKIEGVHLHLYGKIETKPFRKMGHFNISGKSKDAVLDKIESIRNNFRVIS